jgi:hypothetical protein
MDHDGGGTEHLRSMLSRFVGQICWSVISGQGTGSQFTLRLGAKVPFSIPLKNPNLTEDEKRFDGEMWIYIEAASWRLEKRGQIVCGSTSPNGKGEEMTVGLQQLVGATIKQWELMQPAHDLNLVFSNEVVLRVFCDQMFEYDNYSIGAMGSRSLTVGPRGRVG